MRFFFLALAILWSALCSATTAFAQAAFTQAADPGIYGLQLEKKVQGQMLFAQGSGIHFGNGLILTAAHVVSRDPTDPTVRVYVDQLRLPGRVQWLSSDPALDLALVRVEPKDLPPRLLTQPPPRLCRGSAPVSRDVKVVAGPQVSDSQTIPRPINSDHQEGDGTNLLIQGFPAGTSGGGVFDRQDGCLWGIVFIVLSGPSSIPGRTITLTAFVPAARIAPILAAADIRP